MIYGTKTVSKMGACHWIFITENTTLGQARKNLRKWLRKLKLQQM